VIAWAVTIVEINAEHKTGAILIKDSFSMVKILNDKIKVTFKLPLKQYAIKRIYAGG
jgi:hypothetical protein